MSDATSTSPPPFRAITRSMFALSLASSLLTLFSSSFAAEVVVPNALANARGNINNNSPWNCASAQSQRYQQVYLGSEVGSGTITHIAFQSLGGPFGPTTLSDVTITLSSTTAAPDTLSNTFGANVGADVKTVHAGDLSLSSAGAGSPPALVFNTVITLQSGFSFVAGTGKNLLLDVNIPQCVTLARDPAFLANANFGAHSAQGDSISRLFDYGPEHPGLFTRDTAGLVTRFTIEPLGPPPPPTALLASVLPSSRSVQVGATATAFVTIINTGPNTAFAVGISLASPVPATFKFNQTSCQTNAVIGGDDVPATVPAAPAPPVGPPINQACYVISITPFAAFAPTEVAFEFSGSNTPPVATLKAINTLLMSASVAPVPDIVALAATATNDGILHLPGPAGAGAFSVATSNVGIGEVITASGNTGATALPLALSICQTNPATGECISPIGPSVAVQINAAATPTFAIFATASGAITLDPAVNRIFVVFSDGANVVRGRTSVAVTTQ